MELFKSVIYFVTLIISTCASRELFAIPKSDNFPHLVEETVKGLVSCYENETTDLGLAGKPFKSLLGTHESQSVVLIGNSARAAINVEIPRELRYKLKLFVVVVSSPTELLKILEQIKESHWWNHMASYLIINWPPAQRNECSDAFEFLQIAWKLNLINAKFVCFPEANKRLIYNYNPYTNKAPEPWQPMNTPSPKDDQPWTLFQREYQETDDLCHRLDFDKTADINGHKIRTTLKITGNVDIDINKTGVDSIGGHTGEINRILFRALHAGVATKVYNNSEHLGYLGNKGESIVMDVVRGTSDFLLNVEYLRNMQNYSSSRPCFYAGITIFTQPNRAKSPLEKIISVIDITSRYGVLLVISFTFIFFKYFRRLDGITAILNLIRLICNSSLTKVPTNVPARIYLSSLFIFIVTIQAIYQGQLSSLLTKPVSLPDVETLQDLANKNCKIYGHTWWAYLFDDPSFAGRYIADENFDCTDKLLRDPSGACIAGRLVALYAAKEKKLHIAKEDFGMIPLVYAFREDWPLERRLNMAIETMLEAGIYWREANAIYEKEYAIRKANEKSDEQGKYEVITMEELAFAFTILGICLVCSTVVFIVEMGIDRIRKRTTKLHNKIRMIRLT